MERRVVTWLRLLMPVCSSPDPKRIGTWFVECEDPSIYQSIHSSIYRSIHLSVRMECSVLQG
jgi:hypothetical protein